MNGHFVISLDFELHWGVFDVKSVKDYETHLSQVRVVITRLLVLADQYDIKLTFSTVGFLFAANKEELLTFLPKQQPTYTLKKFSPYPLLESIGDNEQDAPYHYAQSVVKQIKNNGNHEIGTHTFCHYYCHELGQTVEQFEDDLKSAIAIAQSHDIKLESIVFPRNMIEMETELDQQYIDAFYKLGIISFRGKEKAYIYNIHTTKFYHGCYLFKGLRMLDVYCNITGNNTYNLDQLYKKNRPLNLPSSRLLRPYNKRLAFLEPLKIARIKKGMRYAAKNNELFHLWWHPHNFGTHTDENFKNLEIIFKEYSNLNKIHNFKSQTMTDVAKTYIHLPD